MANHSPFQAGFIRTTLFAAAMAILLLWPAGALAQSEGQATFTPTINQKFEARSEPAKVTGEGDETLIGKGYVKVGRITATHPGGKANARITEGLRAAALSKAAEAGGDVVYFLKEGAVETARVPTGKMTRACRRESAITTPVPMYNTVCTTDVHGITTCKQVQYGSEPVQSGTNCIEWGDLEPEYKTVKGGAAVSEGQVWRYDPKLATDIARAEEANRKVEEANRLEPYARNSDGQTNLHLASEDGDTRRVAMLLARGADVNAEGKYGWTPLHHAVFMGRNEIVELLLAHGADVNAKDDVGRTPLVLAMTRPFEVEALAALLLAHGADVNVKANHGWTALHVAAAAAKWTSAKLLLAHGADVNAKNNDGQTPLGLAKSRDVVDLLRQHGGHE